MGWWKIRDADGHIDWDKRGNTSLVNALGGQDTPENYYNGDEPSDYMGEAVDSLLERLERKPSRPQMVALLLRREAGGLQVKNKSHTLIPIVDEAWQRINSAYQREWNRGPYEEEREAIVNFSLGDFQ